MRTRAPLVERGNDLYETPPVAVRALIGRRATATSDMGTGLRKEFQIGPLGSISLAEKAPQEWR